MQFHRNNPQKFNSNEKLKMINSIQSDEINNVCFECGTCNPEYLSINNGVFICKECVQEHFDFPHEISQIIINDLPSLNNLDLKKLYFGGNKKLIEFINFDFPRLKQFPPNILYKTRAVDYYRKRLEFFAQGGIRPIKPIFEYAYQMVNIPKNNFNTISFRKDVYLSPKVNIPNERFSNSTKLTPISEGNQLDDENNCSTNSELKDNEENPEKISSPKNESLINRESNKENNKDPLINNDKANNFIYSPKRPKQMSHNNSAFISFHSSNFNRSFENNSVTNNINPVLKPYKKHVIQKFKKGNNKPENKSDEISSNTNMDGEKNISEIINLNNNEKSIKSIPTINDDNYGDDNTIKIINKYMNNSKESDSITYGNNKEKDSLINDNNIINLEKDKIEENNINNENENKDNTSNKQNKNDYNSKKNISKYLNNENNKKLIEKDTEKNEMEIININDYKNHLQHENDNDKDKNEDIFTKEIKSAKVIYPKDFDKYSERSERKTPKRKHLKARVSTKKIEYEDDDEYEYEKDNYDDFFTKKEKELSPSRGEKYNKNETNKIIPFKNEKSSKLNKKSNFYSDFSSNNFINPFKYLKRSFQKKQEEKFGADSEENSKSEEEEEEEEEEEKQGFFRNNPIKLIKNEKSKKNEINDGEHYNIKTNNIRNDNKELNQRTRNTTEKEGDTKESFESQPEDKNNSIRRKYKNRFSRY